MSLPFKWYMELNPISHRTTCSSSKDTEGLTNFFARFGRSTYFLNFTHKKLVCCRCVKVLNLVYLQLPKIRTKCTLIFFKHLLRLSLYCSKLNMNFKTNFIWKLSHMNVLYKYQSQWISSNQQSFFSSIWAGA